ncbi:hypothetical protein KQX54_008151 [Cotesia glomerata]|uniref:Uncharacterized protein n=1 Tax=Cotesia glomerata TaxID=32391 RepID=A0AAV7IGA9_COTGL|nr:hypothetical protein KQX54_008151 [Cotesia glomerata]
MTVDGLFETTSIPGHLAPTPERLERLLSKQTLEELYEVEEQPFARLALLLWYFTSFALYSGYWVSCSFMTNTSRNLFLQTKCTLLAFCLDSCDQFLGLKFYLS